SCLDISCAGGESRTDHARDSRRYTVHHAPELARLPLSADAEHARLAVVVSSDARLLLPVLDRGRHCACDPHRHVDREGVAPPARDRAASVGWTDSVLGASRLPRVSPRRHGAPQPALRSLRRKAPHGLRSRDPPRWRASAHPVGTQVASAACRRTLLREPPRGPRRDLQPHERCPLRYDLSGPDALACTRELRAVDRRVGDFYRPDRRDDLPLRPRSPSYAGSHPGGTQRGTFEAMIPDLWLEAHSSLRPLADLSAEVDRATAAIDVLDARIPCWEDYRADFLAGVPLLPSTAAAFDLEPGGRMAGALLERLASGASSERLAVQTRALDTELRCEPH